METVAAGRISSTATNITCTMIISVIDVNLNTYSGMGIVARTLTNAMSMTTNTAINA